MFSRLTTLDFQEIIEVQHPPLTTHIPFAPFVENGLKRGDVSTRS